MANLSVRQSGELPRYALLTLADRAVGLHVGIALLAAVLHARAHGRGQSVEIPMFEGTAHLVLGDHFGGKSFEPPLGSTGYARLLASHRRPYATADGYLCLLIYNDKHWRNFFSLIGQDDLMQDPRLCTHTARAQHIDVVYAFVTQVMLTRSSQEWLPDLERADITASHLYSVDDLIDDAHLNATGFIKTLNHLSEGRMRTPGPLDTYHATPTSIQPHAPRLGEHSRELLAEAGYDDEQINSLISHHITLDGAL